MNLSEKAKLIQAVVLDVDGVLTDGRVGYGGADGDEIKFFNVKDGHGIKLLLRAGIRVGMFSGLSSAANRKCAAELRLSFVYENQKNKRQAFDTLLREQNLTAAQCLYVGDDLVDLPLLRRAGIGVSVADAIAEARDAADWITAAGGGRGAVREVAEWLLKEQGKWQEQVARYMD
jgi:3-deoxy-D-manno-octulosonate 8-phosphate phosphatase (KDO 8-P phosphatase)